MQSKKPTPQNQFTRLADLSADLFDQWQGEEKSLAKKRGEAAFYGLAFIVAGLPHRAVKGTVFERRNGTAILSLMGTKQYGLPFGSLPRRVVSDITTQVVKTRSPVVNLGNNLADLLRRWEIQPTGGRDGSILKVKSQLQRFFTCAISVTREEDGIARTLNLMPVHKATLVWDPKHPEQRTLWPSTILLNEDFAKELMDHSFPHNSAKLRALARAPLAMDLYLWVTYRNSYITKPTLIPWPALQWQFWAGYPFTAQGERDFRKKFTLALRKVAVVYPEARKLRPSTAGLLFVPGRPDIPKLG